MQKSPLISKMHAKKSTFSQKAHEKVHCHRKSTPPNPDLATGLEHQWCSYTYTILYSLLYIEMHVEYAHCNKLIHGFSLSGIASFTSTALYLAIFIVRICMGAICWGIFLFFCKFLMVVRIITFLDSQSNEVL